MLYNGVDEDKVLKRDPAVYVRSRDKRRAEDMMWWPWDGWSWGIMGLGLVWTILFWGAIIALIVWGIRKLTSHNTYRSGGKSPLDIAKERYARGEITREQFEQIKRDLNS